MEEELFNINSRFGNFPSYRVTKSGKVYSYRQGNILKPLSVILDSSGYPIVKLYDNNSKPRTILVGLRLIRRGMVTIGNMQMCNNSISRDNQQPSQRLTTLKGSETRY